MRVGRAQERSRLAQQLEPPGPVALGLQMLVEQLEQLGRPLFLPRAAEGAGNADEVGEICGSVRQALEPLVLEGGEIASFDHLARFSGQRHRLLRAG